MQKIPTKINERQNRNRILPSKPSKQSLVARGLAVDEKAATRILNKNAVKKIPRPGVSFYHSSDSDADQVYSVNKKLDRCASLLNNILEEKENVPKKKTNLKAKQSNFAKKIEKKKVVKIVLPTNSDKDDFPSQGNRKQPSRVTKMITSTPTFNKNKAAKSKENELKRQLSEIEKEKRVLQEQYSSLLQQQLSTPVPHSTSSTTENQIETPEAAHPYKMELFPSQLPPGNQNTYTEIHSESQVDPGGRQYSEKDVLLIPIFKELENTVNNISDKLSFPGSLTPSSRSISTQSETVETPYTPSLSNREYERHIQHTESLPRFDEDYSRLSRNGFRRSLSPYLKQNSTEISSSREIYAWPVDNSLSTAYTDSLQAASSPDTSEVTDTQGSESTLASAINSSDSCDNDSDGTENSTIIASTLDGAKDIGNKDIVTGRIGLGATGDNGVNMESESLSGSKSGADYYEITSKEDRDDHQGEERNVFADNGVVRDGDKMKDQVAESCVSEEEEEEDGDGEEDNYEPKTEIVGEKVVLNDGIVKDPKGRKTATKGKGPSLVEKTTKKSGNHKQETNGPEEQNQVQITSNAENFNKPKYYVSPNGVEVKPLMEVTSQLASLKNEMNVPKKPNNRTGLTERPGYAATQITMLNYLFKELVTLLGDKLNSEEGRLLTEIDHIIGLLPFVMNNLNPDLQTEISIAVQPLRVENSDLRRQLRIAKQRVRDFELQIEQMGKELVTAKKRTIDEDQLEKFKNQITVDGEQRKMLIQKIADVTKAIEELKLENKNLVKKLADKDAEDLHKVKQLQKEKSTLASENSSLISKAESISLTLQAQQKENKILKLSLSQSEAEIARVKELNRGLQESVAKLLRDVNFKDTRTTLRQAEGKRHLTQTRQDAFFPKKDNLDPRYLEKRRHVVAQRAWNEEKGFPGDKIENCRNTDASHRTKCSATKPEPSKILENATKDPHLVNPELILTKNQQTIERRSDMYNKDAISSDIASEALSSTLASESDEGCRVDSSTTSCNDLDSCISIDDRYSTLTCDSGEFQLNLANLDADIKKLQISLQTAKTKT